MSFENRPIVCNLLPTFTLYFKRLKIHYLIWVLEQQGRISFAIYIAFSLSQFSHNIFKPTLIICAFNAFPGKRFDSKYQN